MHFQPKAFSASVKCSRAVPIVIKSRVSKSIYINSQKLKEVSDTKFLGVILDYKLGRSSYIFKLNRKLRSGAALLRKARHLIPEEHYLKIYHALFESHLTY